MNKYTKLILIAIPVLIIICGGLWSLFTWAGGGFDFITYDSLQNNAIGIAKNLPVPTIFNTDNGNAENNVGVWKSYKFFDPNTGKESITVVGYNSWKFSIYIDLLSSDRWQLYYGDSAKITPDMLNHPDKFYLKGNAR